MAPDIPKPLLNDPHQTICDFYESRYRYAGNHVFRFASLLGVSTVTPDIEKADGTTQRTNLNILLIGNSGSGKSEMMKDAAKWSYNSWEIGKATASKLEDEVAKTRNKQQTLVVDDFKRCLQTKGFVKVFEQVVDGRINKQTSRGSAQADDLEISSIGGGVFDDIISPKIFTGWLPRMLPLFIIYSREKQKEVGRRIANGYTENPSQVGVTEDDIVAYYDTLHGIQDGENSSIDPIEGFVFESDDVVDIIYEEWKAKVDRYADNKKYFFRDLEYAFGFAANHAFLNLFQRKVSNQTLHVTEEDAEVAKNLLDISFRTKANVMDNPEATKSFASMNETAPGLNT